jgi:hypothetical protein
MHDRNNLIAYLATVASIVVLALAGAAACLFFHTTTEVGLAKLIGALAFIGTAIAGLTGIAGTFKASQIPTTTQNIDNAKNVNAGKDVAA